MAKKREKRKVTAQEYAAAARPYWDDLWNDLAILEELAEIAGKEDIDTLQDLLALHVDVAHSGIDRCDLIPAE